MKPHKNIFLNCALYFVTVLDLNKKESPLQLLSYLNRGKDSTTEEAFRKDYGRLSELRSLVHRDVPVIALTATATEATRNMIIKDLCMKDCVQILGDPNKSNIRYSVINDVDHEDLYGTFKFIIDDLEKNQIKATKVIVFCRRKGHVKELFELFTQCLGPKAYYRPTGEEPQDDRSRLFAMYHKRTHKLVKQTVETEFCKEDGTVRVVFCTIAFGMGINVQGGNIVIHLGPSSGLDDYLQESGRVGRKKDVNAHAVLLKYKGCTRSRNISKPMKEYVNNSTTCRRVLLLKQFCSTPLPNSERHSCCDICAQNCKCLCKCARGQDKCSCKKTCNAAEYRSDIENELLEIRTSKVEAATKSNGYALKGKKAAQLREDLLDYRLELAGNLNPEQVLTGIDLATGFSRSLVDSVVACAATVDSLEVLMAKFDFFDKKHAEFVWQCLCDLSFDSDSDSGQTNESEDSASDDSDIEMFLRKRRAFLLSSSGEERSD